jgi:hypothetical protein
MTRGFEFGGKLAISRSLVLALLLALGGLAIGCGVVLLHTPRSGAGATPITELAGAERDPVGVRVCPVGDETSIGTSGQA